MTLQGPHHVAKKSINTGVSPPIISLKVIVVGIKVGVRVNQHENRLPGAKNRPLRRSRDSEG